MNELLTKLVAGQNISPMLILAMESFVATIYNTAYDEGFAIGYEEGKEDAKTIMTRTIKAS